MPLWSLLVFHKHIVGSVDLVSLQTVQKGDTHHSRFQATGTAHGGKHRRFHLDISDTRGMGCTQIRLFVFLCVGAEGAIQTALPLIEVQGAHGVAHNHGELIQV